MNLMLKGQRSMAIDSILILLLPGGRSKPHEDTTVVVKFGNERVHFSKGTHRPMPPGRL